MFFVEKIRKLISDKRGNIALTLAVALLPIMASVGAAVDYSRASNLRTKIAHATDAALLAATAIVIEEVELNNTRQVKRRLRKEFKPYFLANMANVDGFRFRGFRLRFDPVTKGVTVKIKADYKTTLLNVIGKKRLRLNVMAATGMNVINGGAMSMFLVLDRSGSMLDTNGVGGTKMDSLKLAVSNMISGMGLNDPDEKYIRMGAISYDTATYSVQPIKWDLSRADSYARAMTAYGGTDSSDAIKMAYNHLRSPSEISKHRRKNGHVPELVMVFMTDGNNNDPADDTATVKTCGKAKTEGMEVYAVAFQAPSNGQALLKNCATDISHYFEPKNTAELIKAFEYIGKTSGDKLRLSH